MTHRILLASGNPGKVAEFAALLPEFEVAPPASGEVLPPEIGATYAENAVAKAEALCRGNDVVLADDSGLEVAALDGAPGLRSARWAPGSDGDRAAALQAALRATGLPAPWPARFVCVVALARPNEDPVWKTGVLEGAIIDERRGAGGFGYDPVFVPAVGADAGGARDRTLAQMSKEEKNSISHRARAVALIRPVLKDCFFP